MYFHFASIVSVNCIFPMVEKHVDLVRFKAFALAKSVDELADSVCFPPLPGFLSHRDNVKQSKIYQQKAT